MDNNKWTAEAVSDAILKNNSHLDIVFSNYLRTFIERLEDYDINLQEIINVDQLYRKIQDGIEKLEPMRKEFLSVVEIFAPSKHPFLKIYLPVFLEKLLNFYEEQGINLYTGTNIDLIRNDHYRFFNQFLLISLAAMLVENNCFDALQAILHSKYRVYDKESGITLEVNFIRFREYNYTLNEFLNISQPKRLSVTADYMYKYTGTGFERLVKADILLYYISIWNPTNKILDPFWYPELNVYNRDKSILPNLVSKKYFDAAKVLFGVDTVKQFKDLLDNTDDSMQHKGLYRVPQLKDGLMYNTVAIEE